MSADQTRVGDPLALHYDFNSLSLADLLHARDTYHFHLLNKANVVGTAVGLYLIRKDEDWPEAKSQGVGLRARKTYPRTLSNSEVRDYSWPCILALVRVWEPEEAFGKGGQYDPTQMVPKTLYLADGRAVPVCVVVVDEVPNSEANLSNAPADVSPSFKFGGGLPIIVRVQGAERYATAGCLVTDGHLTYALTARHVCGETGTSVFSRLRSGDVNVGVSSPKQLTRELFSSVYEDFPGRRSFITLDVGLIRLDDIDAWTSNTYGLPPLGPIADVHEHNLTLRLIDRKVVGYGAASGLLRGTIKALFYRYRSVGGYDYVGDFVIGSAEGSRTQPGDSGMVWHLDLTIDPASGPPAPLPMRDLRPIAVEWGGQVFDEGGRRSTFAVATSLSNVCKLLDVELVTDLSRGVSGYWGRTGHYSIAAFAIRMVNNEPLRQFLQSNAHLLSFDLDAIKKTDFDKTVGQLGDAFVPLADVPDEIWKKLPRGKNAREGGRDTSGGPHGSNGPEHPNHYADIDAPLKNGKNWRTMCLEDDANISVNAWQAFYEQMAKEADDAGDTAAAKQYRSSLKQGLLPFRVWQIFKAMADALADGNLVEFLTAAGVLAHYVGDASQPLHGSVFADGDPSRTSEREHPRLGTTETVKYGEGVHSAYETAMISFKALDLLPLIDASLPSRHGLPLCGNAKQAARSILELMDKVARKLSPMAIIESYESAGASTRQETLNTMWRDLKGPTASVMSLGAIYLAMLWDSAWTVGNGDAIAPGKLRELNNDKVRDRYIDSTFAKSMTLKEIRAVL